jgi:EAL domain-containing protein (putative c-di-GMP-specific phosphodiesterase class I)
MNRLREIGVELSLDDFGTGYSSLSYLHRLPVNSLKIDRSFVSRMAESEENSEIVRTIVRLAQNLKMDVIAEGIETDEQLMQLNELNCGFGQGYLFAKPMPAETAADFLNEHIDEVTGLTEQPVMNAELNM